MTTARETVAVGITSAEHYDPYAPRLFADRPNWTLYEGQAEKAIAAYHAWLEANGWAIVPKVPTGAMIAALFEQEPDDKDIARYSGDWSEEWYGDQEDFGESFAAMLAAAPKPVIDK